MKTVGAFTSDRARITFLAAYDRALDRRWPQRTAQDLPTAFGSTRVYLSGPEDGVPVMLLPGAGGNSLMWHRYVADLAEYRRVIAVDPVGEPGGSTQERPIEGVDDVTEWLDEV